MKKLIYYIMSLIEHGLEDDILKVLKKEKKLTVFDVGCYRGVFTKKILKFVGKKKIKFYLFDVNKNVKKYILNILKLKNVNFHEIALHNKNGKALYHYNSFFDCSGSSLSSLIANDKKWILSRKILLKMLFLSTKDFVKYEVPTITLDSFVKRNNIKLIDILKIDIDGSEYQMLQGAKNTLKNNKVKIILVEIIGKKNLYDKKEKKVLNFLKKRNYTLIKKANTLSISLFSNIKGGDYLFINNSYFSSLR